MSLEKRISTWGIFSQWIKMILRYFWTTIRFAGMEDQRVSSCLYVRWSYKKRVDVAFREVGE